LEADVAIEVEVGQEEEKDNKEEHVTWLLGK
jgi:hypothetical protein